MTSPTLTSRIIQLIGEEENITVIEKGGERNTERDLLEGKLLVTLSAIVQGQPWELVFTSRTPLQLRSISSSEYDAMHSNQGPPGKSRAVSNLLDSTHPIAVNRSWPKRKPLSLH